MDSGARFRYVIWDSDEEGLVDVPALLRAYRRGALDPAGLLFDRETDRWFTVSEHPLLNGVRRSAPRAAASATSSPNAQPVREPAVEAAAAPDFAGASGRIPKGKGRVASRIVIATFIVCLIAVSLIAVNQADNRSDRPRLPVRQPSQVLPSTSQFRPEGVVRTPDRFGSAALKLQIDAGRERLRSLEERLQSLQSEMALLDSQMASYKDQIDRARRSAALGMDVNEYAYRAAVNNYNDLVPRYNQRLAEYRSIYDEYETQLQETNELVDLYNARR
jgi:hypothetical protein